MLSLAMVDGVDEKGVQVWVHRRYLDRISVDLCRSLYVNQIQVALRIACDFESDTFLVSTKIYEMFESISFARPLRFRKVPIQLLAKP